MDEASRAKIWKIVMIVCRVALAAIFLYAGYSKIKPPDGFPWSFSSIRIALSFFGNGVDSYQILPPWAVSLVANFLPPFELVLGVWLLTGVGLRFSSLISTLTICLFIYAMFSAWRRGLTINCGCFGTQSTPVTPKDMMRDGLLFLPLALVLSAGSFRLRKKSNPATVVTSTA